jgi:hypothetical protein
VKENIWKFLSRTPDWVQFLLLIVYGITGAIGQNRSDNVLWATFWGWLLLSSYAFFNTAKFRCRILKENIRCPHAIHTFQSGLFPVIVTVTLGIATLLPKMNSYFGFRQLSSIAFISGILFLLAQAVLLGQLTQRDAT